MKIVGGSIVFGVCVTSPIVYITVVSPTTSSLASFLYTYNYLYANIIYFHALRHRRRTSLSTGPVYIHISP